MAALHLGELSEYGRKSGAEWIPGPRNSDRSKGKSATLAVRTQSLKHLNMSAPRASLNRDVEILLFVVQIVSNQSNGDWAKHPIALAVCGYLRCLILTYPWKVITWETKVMQTKRNSLKIKKEPSVGLVAVQSQTQHKEDRTAKRSLVSRALDTQSQWSALLGQREFLQEEIIRGRLCLERLQRTVPGFGVPTLPPLQSRRDWYGEPERPRPADMQPTRRWQRSSTVGWKNSKSGSPS
jgi:hypothetical protein